MIEKIKEIGWTGAGLIFAVIAILLIAFFVRGGVSFIESHQDLINSINDITAGIFLLLLFFSVIPKLRIFTGPGIVYLTYLWIFLFWLTCLVVTYEFWGFIGIFIGVIMFGLGLFITAPLAILFSGQGFNALLLVLSIGLTYLIRNLGLWITSKYPNKDDAQNIIAIAQDNPDDRLEQNDRGFIQIPILILIMLGALTFGGAGYGVSKYQQSQAEEARRAGTIENLTKEVEVLKNQQVASNNESIVQKVKPTVIERAIQKPVIVEQKKIEATSTSQTQVSPPPATTVSDTMKLERQAFDTWSQTSQKAVNELSNAIKYVTSALTSATGDTGSVATLYAQNAIDACNSSYQLNLNNAIPKLPFSNDLNQVNQIIGNMGMKCKQMAQAYQESFKYYVDVHSDSYNPYKAKDLTVQAGTLMDEYNSLGKNQYNPAIEKVNKDVNDYFKSQ